MFCSAAKARAIRASTAPGAGFLGRVAGVVLLLVLAMVLGRSLSYGQTDCQASPSTYDADTKLSRQPSPTLLRMQSFRYVQLRWALRGLTCSGVPLVAFDGLRYRPAAYGEDPGLCFFVPELARLGGIRLTTAADGLLAGAVLLATLVGLAGFLRLAQTAFGRRIGLVIFPLLAVIVLVAGDVCVMNAAPAIACVPWLLYFLERRKITAGLLLTVCLTGLFSETATLFRFHAGTPVLLFAMALMLVAYHVKPLARVLLVALLLLAAALPQMMFRELFARRDAFLAHQSGAVQEVSRAHAFWHSIYIGLAFLPNSDVPQYLDEVGQAKVESLHPGAVYLSPEYERVLRQEVIRLAERRPFLILATLISKLLVVLLLTLASANVGLYAARLARPPALVNVAFALAIAFNGLFGILVYPKPKYLVGLIAFAALYAAYSIESAARQPDSEWRLGWMQKLMFIGSPRKVEVPS